MATGRRKMQDWKMADCKITGWKMGDPRIQLPATLTKKQIAASSGNMNAIKIN